MSDVERPNNDVERPAASTQGDAPESVSANLAAARERYRRERDKRLRADANDQYPEPSERLKGFLVDPWVGNEPAREPLDVSVHVVVVGAGIGGLLAGVNLRMNGVDDILIIDHAGDFGGTWYWNRFPGTQCDFESFVYMPMLEELGYVPREKYSHGPEILDHCRAIARKYGLYDKARFQTEVTELHWDDESNTWLVLTNRGDKIRTRFVTMAPGAQDEPRFAAIPGVESFAGHMMHTSRWDYSYTGGNPEGGLTGLRDKRVGIVGTGATAVQCVPHVGEWAQHLYVFQRTPTGVSPRHNSATPDGFGKDFEPGWQRRRQVNFASILLGHDCTEDLVDDGWTARLGKISRLARQDAMNPSIGREPAAEMADLQIMDEIRQHVSRAVHDPAVAAALMPYYRFFCKRPGFHDDYLDTFNRSNVTLVDTDGHGVSSICPEGVLVGDQLYELDCLIFATGFDVGRGYLGTRGLDLYGRDGVRLSEWWKGGMRTYQGFHAHGFPNCFFMGRTQSGISPNQVHSLAEQAEHIAYLVKTARDRDICTIEAGAEAEEKWVSIIRSQLTPGVLQFQAECTPGYYNSEGKVGDHNGFRASGYMDVIGYWEEMARWREAGDLSGLDVVIDAKCAT